MNSVYRAASYQNGAVIVYKDQSFPGRGIERLSDEQREIKELRSQFKDKEFDLEILKKATAFFSRADK